MTLRRIVHRSPRLTALARGVREALAGPSATRSHGPGGGAGGGGARGGGAAPAPDSVLEFHDVEPTLVDGPGGPRLNLLLPTINPGRAFGGARTALDLHESLGRAFGRSRIVTFTVPTDDALAGLDGYRRADPETPSDEARLVVAAPRGERIRLAVEPGEVFVATFWTTAHLARDLTRWQAATTGAPPRPFAYLVQDFEPGFYPWSAQWALARATYDGTVPTIGIVNSSLLADHLAAEGIGFAETHVFEPRLAPGLRRVRDEVPPERARRVVVYGRPETPRNAFPLVVDGLRAWIASDPGAAAWDVVSVGRPHPPVELGAGRRLRSLGTLDLEAYGRLLRTSAVGLSLMISPHPSYPPLDMAHLGMRVVSNRFGGKDLSAWHENITSPEVLDAASIGAALAAAAAAHEADPGAGDRARALRPDYLSDEPPFPFAAAVADRLVSGF